MTKATAGDLLPEERLARYLEAHVAGFRGPLTARKFRGGQSNPTYRIDAQSGAYVLRRKPAGVLLPSAHAVDREYRVLEALHGSAVPVAQPLHLCTDDSIIGSMFYLMAHVDGRVLWDPALPGMDAGQRRAMYGQVVAVLAAIHRIDVGMVGLVDFGRAGNYFDRQLRRWSEQYRASALQPVEDMDHLIEALPAHCPADDGQVALVHGDFRIDNLIWHPEQPTVCAVVDWELSTLGHPLADLGYFCMALRLPQGGLVPGLAGIDRAPLGIPDEPELLAEYAAATGRSRVPDWNFVLAFSFFRLAAIAQGVAQRALQGNASSSQAGQAGDMVPWLARQARAVLDGATAGLD